MRGSVNYAILSLTMRGSVNYAR